MLEQKPGAKLALLYQNDDFGKDYLKGFKDGLGAKAASMIVIEPLASAAHTATVPSVTAISTP